ncbi:MAG: putative metal-binding motif-containing protein [Myxococcales bacterium]|nr:putative metal-binding motif-containing protein [Myxococcales bacterium]
MRARLGLIGALVLYAPLLGCGILGFGADIPVSCNDGPRTCADLNTSNPTGDSCTFWACIDNRCQVVPKDTDQDGVLDNGCEPEGSPPDCDENDNRRFPGNPEICDYIDNSCNDKVDEGFAYGVSEEHLWPFSDAEIDDPININFATQSSEQGLILAATFDYGTGGSQEAGLAAWSAIDVAPNPFRIFKKIIMDTADGTPPESMLGGSWLTTTNYYNTLPVIADNDLGIVAAATYSGVDRYFAGLVQSEPTETLVRIHEDFHDQALDAGLEANRANAAWTENGTLVVGIKSCTNDCSPSELELSSLDAFVHLLDKNTSTQAWSPMANYKRKHLKIGHAPDATEPPALVGLPSNHWLVAHFENSTTKIRLTFARVTDDDVETVTLSPDIDLGEDGQGVALVVGPSQDDTTTVALSYVTADNRAHVKLFSLTEAPTPQATELVTVDALVDDEAVLAHARPLVAFHPDLAEWIFVWRDGASHLGMVRLEQDGTIIPETFTHALAQEGRVLDQGFGLAALRDSADSGAYALVTYAKDNTASVFVTGAISCGIQ